MTASAPTISCMYPTARGDFSCGLASRLKAATKLAAVIRSPVLKRKLRLSTIVLVRPSRDSVGKSFATSGIGFRLVGAGASG